MSTFVLTNAFLDGVKERIDFHKTEIPPPDSDNRRSYRIDSFVKLLPLQPNLVPREGLLGVDMPSREVLKLKFVCSVIRKWGRSSKVFADEAAAIQLFKPKKNMSFLRKRDTMPFDLTTPEGVCWIITNQAPTLFATLDPSQDDQRGKAVIVDFCPLFRELEMRPRCKSIAITGSFRVHEGQLSLVNFVYQGNVYEVGDAKFCEMARLFDTAALVASNWVSHTMNTHLLTSESFTFANVVNLPSDHPVRRLTYRCEFGNSTSTDKVLSIFTGKGGLAAKVFGITDEAMASLILSIKNNFHLLVVTFPMLLRKNGFADEETLKTFPLMFEMNEWWKVLVDYNQTYLRIYYKSDEDVLADQSLAKWHSHLAELLQGVPPLTDTAAFETLVQLTTVYMFVSSVYHEVVGKAFADLPPNPFQLTSIVRDGPSVPEQINTVEETKIRFAVGESAGIINPRLVQPWAHHAAPGPQQHEAEVALNRLVDLAARLDSEIEQRNMSRKCPVLKIMSHHLGCSVSV